ncbi:hypothetical protein ACXR0O_01985 [Verrucomicrobiota bacterium sgz303538]
MTAPDPYTALREALQQRLAVIIDREAYQRDATAHLERLKTVSEQIAQLSSELPRPVDPQLAHFLQRCSYDKALAFLEQLPR